MPIPISYYVGRRVSFDSFACTVRYIGGLEFTDKEWIGVEWDNPSRGKHYGFYRTHKYFVCASKSLTCASFLPIHKLGDDERYFLDAVIEKYCADDTDATHSPLDRPIEISGKVVQNVGFEKIKKEQAQLEKLEIVLVDGFKIKYADVGDQISSTCPNIVELDLSRNLFESFEEIILICRELEKLQSLRLSGNRLKFSTSNLKYNEAGGRYGAFGGVRELVLDEMLMPWEDIAKLASFFQSLTKLSASSNGIISLPAFPLLAPKLTSLNLDDNRIETLSDISLLTDLPNLQTLQLKGNSIRTIGSTPPVFSHRLTYIDLSYNQINDWNFVDQLVEVFPGMVSLRMSSNPLYLTSSADDGFMLTLARIESLKTLNFSSISAQERTNAELFYLSRVALEIAQSPEHQEDTVKSRHKHYVKLCEKHDTQTSARRPAGEIDPDSLEARLIKFTFYLPEDTLPGQKKAIVKSQELPKDFDVYRVKNIVGKRFRLRPLSLRLIWETGQFHHLTRYEEERQGQEEDDEEEGEGDINNTRSSPLPPDKGKGVLRKREVELVNGTRPVGILVDGMEVIVRVEIVDDQGDHSTTGNTSKETADHTTSTRGDGINNSKTKEISEPYSSMGGAYSSADTTRKETAGYTTSNQGGNSSAGDTKGASDPHTSNGGSGSQNIAAETMSTPEGGSSAGNTRGT